MAAEIDDGRRAAGGKMTDIGEMAVLVLQLRERAERAEAERDALRALLADIRNHLWDRTYAEWRELIDAALRED